MIRITPQLAISEREIEEQFIHASGPGGQNVNKVASAVQLRFDVRHSSLPEEVKQRLKHIAGGQMTAEDILIFKSQRFRTLERNRQDAVERLVELIRRASIRPKPRRATKPTLASQQRRLQTKRQRGDIKNSRRSMRRSGDE